MKRLFLIGATATAALLLVPTTPPVGVSVAQAASETEFICPDEGAGLSAVDVLQSTGEHDVFLDYLSEYDPEGYEILTDPAASDKTIWAPTDAAFAKLGEAPESASPEEILAHSVGTTRNAVVGPRPAQGNQDLLGARASAAPIGLAPTARATCPRHARVSAWSLARASRNRGKTSEDLAHV